jgi:hypothetical protein
MCAVYAPLLPLLQTDELPPEQEAATREHLRSCAWCRSRVAQYDRLYAALRSRFDPDVMAAGVDVPSAREIAALSTVSSSGGRSQGAERRSSQPDEPEDSAPSAQKPAARWHVPRVALRLEAAAAILLIALLAGLLLWRHGPGQGGPPPLDPQSQAYVAALRTEYLPLLDAKGTEVRQCVTAFESAPTSDQPQLMADCRPLEVAVQTDSQTLLSHLQTIAVPSRWQSANGQLKTWAQAEIDFSMARIQAIDAHDVARFRTLGVLGTSNQSGCSAIQQINAALPSDSQLPVSASGECAARSPQVSP